MEEHLASNFIFDIIDDDLASGREDHVHTRFPPEPNGMLHIGSAKAIYINFNIEIEGLPGRETLPEGVEVTSVIKV